MKYSIVPFWDARVMNPVTKQSRIMLTINLSKQQFRFSLKLHCTKIEFDKVIGSGRGYDQHLRSKLFEYVTKAERILERLKHPSKEVFMRLFKSQTQIFQGDKTAVKFFFEQRIEQFKKEQRFGSARNCKLARNSLLKFQKDLCFEDINEMKLKEYVSWMTGKGNSQVTAFIYLRELKVLCRRAMNEGYILESPFTSFSVSSSIRSKSVLYPEQLKHLWEYQCHNERETKAKDMFFFLYLCNGMNYKDACYLKWKNINGNILTFKREKTKRTAKGGGKEIQVYLHEEAWKILNRWGNTEKVPNQYVFAMFKDYQTLEQLEYQKERYRRTCNNILVKIGKELGFDVHLCLNLARHSFATILKLNGTPVSFISDAMGHSDTKVTEHYLKSLPNENLKKMSELLMQF